MSLVEIRMIPGVASVGGFRALLLVRGSETPPALVLRPTGGGESRAAAVSPVASRDPRVDAAIRGRGFRLHRAVVGAPLPADATFRAVATLADRRIDVPLKVPGDPRTGTTLTLVVASCFYDGFGGDAHYLATLRDFAADADLRLLIGDNVYVDVPAGDVVGGNAARETVERYLQYVWSSGYSQALAAVPSATTYDDHEFWNNFPEWVPWLTRTLNPRPWTDAGRACLDSFQAVLDPAGIGRTRSFRIDDLPCVDLFFADMRSQRESRSGAASRMMPESALDALETWAAGLVRPGLLVVGQPLWHERGTKRIDLNPPAFDRQYERIWNALAAAPADVFVVCGDVHHSRLLRLDGQDLRPRAATSRSFHEVTTSPVCHIPENLDTGLRRIPWVGDFLAGAPDQAKGRVEGPGRLEYERVRVPGANPRFGRYLFGTNAPNSVAMLRLRRLPSTKVEVEVSFLDTKGRGVARSVDATFGSATHAPASPTCTGTFALDPPFPP